MVHCFRTLVYITPRCGIAFKWQSFLFQTNGDAKIELLEGMIIVHQNITPNGTNFKIFHHEEREQYTQYTPGCAHLFFSWILEILAEWGWEGRQKGSSKADMMCTTNTVWVQCNAISVWCSRLTSHYIENHKAMFSCILFVWMIW